jgi:hypothetical protein
METLNFYDLVGWLTGEPEYWTLVILGGWAPFSRYAEGRRYTEA